MAPPPSKVKNPAVKGQLRFSINCGLPAEQGIVDVGDFEQFLREHLKVNGKVGNLGDGAVSTSRKKNSRVVITSRVHLSKRYLKYLTKEYLHKRHLRDVMRLIANTRDGFELRFYKVDQDEEDEEDDD